LLAFVMVSCRHSANKFGKSINQLLFAPLVIVRITAICFCIYSVTAWVHTVLKAKVHRVQTSGDSKMYSTIHEITVTVTITNENYTFIAITRRYLLHLTIYIVMIVGHKKEAVDTWHGHHSVCVTAMDQARQSVLESAAPCTRLAENRLYKMQKITQNIAICARLHNFVGLYLRN